MDKKELKKLNRYQLLELLIAQTERADMLQEKIKKLEEQTNNQVIHLSSLGSVADAAVQVSGVLEAAQKAADIYLETVKNKVEQIEKEAHKKAEEIIKAAEDDAARLTIKKQRDI